MQRGLAAGLTCAAVLSAAAILVSPLASGRPAARYLSAMVYATGSLVCHQRPERSFHLRGVRLPVCARCTALYLLGAIGAVAGWFGAPRVPRLLRPLLGMAALPVALTLGAEWAGLVAPGNVVRAASAVPLGLLAGWLFVRMLRAEGPAVQMRYDFHV